jgi:hypothetical protein
MKKLYWSFLATIAWLAANQVHAQQASGKDINPALLYWQAFAVSPELSQSESKQFFESEWRNQPLDKEAAATAAKYDHVFKLLRQAAHSTTPCDWGIDLSAGPETLLPHLAKAKRCAQAAVLRARLALQKNRQDDAAQNLIAAFALGRNTATDKVLISCMVQFAIESIVTGELAQQWDLFRPETIAAVLKGIDSAPPRTLVAECIPTEKKSFYDWIVEKTEQIRAKHPGSDAAAVAEITTLFNQMFTEEGSPDKGKGAQIIRAAGGSTAGILEYLRPLEHLYAEFESVLKLPYKDYNAAAEQLRAGIESHPNLIVKEMMGALLNCRIKEFRVQSREAMIRAAFEIRNDPAHGLEKIADPFGNGPFEYSRFVLDGVDRGFKLKSGLVYPDYSDVLIFAERSGPAFYIDGPKAGQKIQ